MLPPVFISLFAPVAYDAIAVGLYAIAIIIVCHVQKHCMLMVTGSDAIARRV